MKNILVIFLAFLAFACATPPKSEVDFSGNWHAYLDISPDRIPFGLTLEKRDGKLIAILQNDTELLEFKEVITTGDSMKIVLDTFDAEINAKINSEGGIEGTQPGRGDGADEHAFAEYCGGIGGSDRDLEGGQIDRTGNDGGTAPSEGPQRDEVGGDVLGNDQRPVILEF